MVFPRDRYTPHGYLDNPLHTRNLHPSGVIRSTAGVGFGWHYPALARGYGFQQIYHASINLAVSIDGVLTYRRPDFVELHAPYHSKNVFTYRWCIGAVQADATFHRIGEHALVCRLHLTQKDGIPTNLRVIAFSEYERQLGAAGVWGESGLVGRLAEEKVVLQGFEDGEAFALGAGQPCDHAGVSSTLDEGWLQHPSMPGEDHVVVTGRRGDSVHLYGAVACEVTIQPQETQRLEFILARSIRRDLALKQHEQASADKELALAELLTEDKRFWAGAPTLKGDWPDHWRRGFVYDLETLRMMVRQPTGIYGHVWDAMQIQAPRVVLAEAAIDALLLAYADVTTARELLLGTFVDAPQANIPCSREDGSYNMVSANGSECGTAPEWGYPIQVVSHIYNLDPHPEWLAALYPKLTAFLHWWLEHRRDHEGYLVYDNSWESGQDLSARFGPQKEGGGSTIRMVRPVDLHAAMASAFRIMKGFAAILALSDDVQQWQALEEEFCTRMESLWQDGEYRDHDARVGWSDVWDVMQLAPVALGIAREERAQALRERISRLDGDHYLWPMFVWTATDAALALGELETAARIAADTIDRAYRYWDAVQHEEGKPLPGITSEYWGLDGRCGAEGYGWGAFGIHLLLRTIIGFRIGEDHAFELVPNLPEELLHQGREYRIANVPYQGAMLTMRYHVLEEGLEIEVQSLDGTVLSAEGETGTQIRWRSRNGAHHTITLHPRP